MTAIAISANFNERRMWLFADGTHNLGDFVAHFSEVHSIDNFSGDIVTFGSIDNLLKRCRPFHRGAHGEEVVFANEDDRQFIKRAEIQSFVERALIDRAVAEEAECYTIFVTVFDRKGQSNSQRHVGADDRMAAIHVILAVEKMHRAAQAARTAGFFSKELCHACVGAGAASKSMRVIAVSGDDIIIVAHRGNRAGHNGLLADIKMTKTADLLRLILLAGAFLKTPDQEHQREHLDFVALLYRLHGGHPAAAGRNAAARARDRLVVRPRFMQTIKSSVKIRSLRSELRKNIQLGVALY